MRSGIACPARSRELPWVGHLDDTSARDQKWLVFAPHPARRNAPNRLPLNGKGFGDPLRVS